MSVLGKVNPVLAAAFCVFVPLRVLAEIRPLILDGSIIGKIAAFWIIVALAFVMYALCADWAKEPKK